MTQRETLHDADQPALGVESRQMRAALEAKLFGRMTEPPRAGRFVLIERVGEGAMGTVWAAYDPVLDRKVALKFMRGIDQDARAVARVRREAMALARVDHPNVVAIHEVGTEGSRIWVAMEFVDRTVADRCRQAPRVPITFDEALGMTIDASAGLAAVHAAGLIHRDIKPSNLLLTRDGRVAVADFGLARAEATDEESSASYERMLETEVLSTALTRPDELLGTPAYMPPEQALGRADARSDQFALCCTLWEVAFGSPPFEGRTLAARVAEIERGRPPAASRHSQVPSWFRTILTRGLAADPAQRWPDVATMHAALVRGRDRGRRRRWIAGAVLGGAAFAAVPTWNAVRERLSCDDGPERLAPVWTTSRRSSLTDAAPAAVDAVDAVARGWVDRYAIACRTSGARDVGVATDPRTWFDAPPLACLAEARERLDVVIETLARTADEAAALRALPSLGDCDLPRARVTMSPEVRLAAARIDALLAAGRTADAAALVDGLAVPADPSAVAEVELASASLAIANKEPFAAARHAERALEVAERSADRVLAARAWVLLARVASSEKREGIASIYSEAAVASAHASGMPSLVGIAAQVASGRE